MRVRGHDDSTLRQRRAGMLTTLGGHVHTRWNEALAFSG
jgi:hypothetical protein